MPAGRPRAFDEKEVLERAMDLFWLRGYQGTATAELLERMGIGRQSMYDTFGSKRDLFLRAILHYRDTRLQDALSMLSRPQSPLQNVADVLRYFKRLAQDKEAKGCFVANSLVEINSHDEETVALLKETLGALEEGILKALRCAEAEGELPPGKSPRALSRALTNAIIGMAVTGKLGLSKASVSDIYAGTLSMLE